MENQNNLHLNEQAIDALRESAKWTMFLSILGFIGIGFMVLAAIFMGFAMSMIPNIEGNEMGIFNAMKGFISIFYLIIAAIYFYPILYLYRYSIQIKNGLQTTDNETISNAFVNLKSHHKFLGIAAIVMISLYILIIIGAVIVGIVAASSAY